MATAPNELGRREMFAEIKKLCKPDNYTNWFNIAREYAVLAATIAGCMMFYNYAVAQGWSRWWALPVYLLSVFIIGAWVQNRLGVLVHEASHFCFFKNRMLNDVAANIFLLFPFFGAISNYRKGHWGHHRYVNDPARDPDLHRLTKHHPRNFPIPKLRFLWEYVIEQCLPHKGVSYIKGRALYVALPMKTNPVKNQDALGKTGLTLLRLAYYGTLITVLALNNWWLHYALFWLVPFLTFYPAVLFLREIAHHGNYPDDGDFTNSRVYKGKWFEREIFFPYGEHNHVLHHMFPTIPHRYMHQAHNVMMNYPPYRDQVVTCNGFFVRADSKSSDPTVLDILAAPADWFLRTPLDLDRGSSDIRKSNAAQVGADEPRGSAVPSAPHAPTIADKKFEEKMFA